MPRLQIGATNWFDNPRARQLGDVAGRKCCHVVGTVPRIGRGRSCCGGHSVSASDGPPLPIESQLNPRDYYVVGGLTLGFGLLARKSVVGLPPSVGDPCYFARYHCGVDLVHPSV